MTPRSKTIEIFVRVAAQGYINRMKTDFQVTRFAPDDINDVVHLFKAIRKTEENYPPRHKVKSDEDIKNWILVGKDADRFLIKDNNKAVAYVSAQKIGEAYDYPTSDKLGNTYSYWKKAFGSQEIIRSGEVDLNDLSVIKRLSVHPDYRGQGLAKKIRAAAVAEVLDQGRVPVSIITDSNEKAKNIAASQGFECIGEYTGNADTRMTSWMLVPDKPDNIL